MSAVQVKPPVRTDDSHNFISQPLAIVTPAKAPPPDVTMPRYAISRLRIVLMSTSTSDVKLNFATEWKYAPAPETAKVQMRPRYELFIDGKFTPPVKGQYFDTINPAT